MLQTSLKVENASNQLSSLIEVGEESEVHE